MIAIAVSWRSARLRVAAPRSQTHSSNARAPRRPWPPRSSTWPRAAPRTALRLAIPRRVRELCPRAVFLGWTITPPTKQVQRNATRFCRGFRGALADGRASFLRQRGEQMQDEWINVWAEIRPRTVGGRRGSKARNAGPPDRGGIDLVTPTAEFPARLVPVGGRRVWPVVRVAWAKFG